MVSIGQGFQAILFIFVIENVNLGSISQIFYEQLLRVQIPKAQKDKSSHQCLFALLGSTRAKAGSKMLVKWETFYLLITDFLLHKI